MTDNPHPLLRHPTDHLVLAWLKHFEQEQAMLGASLEALREVRQRLLGGDFAGLQRALGRQQQAAGAAAELAQRRRLLRQQLAAELGVSEERATLRALAEQVTGAVRQQLLQFRQRLLETAAEIELVSFGNQALIRQSLELLQRLLGSLSSQGPGTSRYTASGTIATGSIGHLFQARC